MAINEKRKRRLRETQHLQNAEWQMICKFNKGTNQSLKNTDSDIQNTEYGIYEQTNPIGLHSGPDSAAT